MYNIIRTAKVKSRQQITDAAEHNFRLRTQNNIDAKRSHLNQILVNNLQVDCKKSNSLQQKLTDYYQKLQIKERKNNVLMLEFVVSASPEFFKNNSKETIKEWVNHQVEFMKNEFGTQLQVAVLHVDESTPHLHFMISTEQKTVKKYKNQKGEFFKETYSLNADRYDPKYLVGLHDRHAAWNKKFHLKRGERNSMSEHITAKEFQKLINDASKLDYKNAIEKMISDIGDDLSLINTKDKVQNLLLENLLPKLNPLFKSNKALKKILEQDRLGEYKQIKKLKDELELQLKDAKERRTLYIEAINEKAQDAKLLLELKKENDLLKSENNNLKRQINQDKIEHTKSNQKGFTL
jgi:hypothetical protein